ncbi:MAG: hypothetical protein J6A19_13490 [Oscillospiraceae bacterium]|nr:hypothetical protein [Oscillospiraceae bacterium]
MKHIRILLFIIPITLTACTNNAVSESISSCEDSLLITEDNSALESRESNSSDITDVCVDTTSNLIGICGEAFDPINFEKRPEYVLNEFLYYRTNYGYTALFDGESYNSYDDPDKFDLDAWRCTEQCQPASGGFFMVNKGENVGGLTCTDAYAEYFINTEFSNNVSFGLMSSTVCFDGEIEVTGYVDRFDGNEGYVDDGELYFYPDGESWQGLPIPYENSYFWTYSLKDGRLMYAPFRLSLGVVYDYSALDLERNIPQGSTAHMKLVLKDIQFNYVNSNFGEYTISTATIVSAERID